MNAVAQGSRRRLSWTVLAVGLIGGAAALTVLDASTAATEQAGHGEVPKFALPAAGERSFADVIEAVSPAVVNISVAKLVRPVPTAGSAQGTSPFDEFFGRFFEMPGIPGGPQGAPRRSEGQGSGFVIDPAGYIATNNHVVEGAEQITVTLKSGETLEAEVVGVDPQTDIALLKVDPTDVGAAGGLAAVSFGDSDSTRVGDWVLAIGNPFGLGGTATAGIVSARGRDIASGPYDDYLQIDAPINSGNSGGPVFNAAGEVIGINTAIFSPNGGNIGIGFAIPSNQARHVLAELRSGGTVSRGWLGVQIQPIDADLAGVLGLRGAGGALIADIEPASPAARSELQVGDVVTRADGEAVDSPRDLARIVAMHKHGEQLALTVVRDGRERSIAVELGDRAAAEPQAAASGGAAPAGADSTTTELGLRLGDLDASLRARLGLDAAATGAVVTEVRPGSEAALQGIQPGDVIVSVNRAGTESAREAQGALAAALAGGQRALVLVRRGDSQRFVALGAA